MEGGELPVRTSSGEAGSVDGMTADLSVPVLTPHTATARRQADVAQLLGTSLLPRSCRAADADAAADAHFKEAVLPAMRAAGEAWLPAALHERGAFEVPLASRISRCEMMMRCAMNAHVTRAL